MKREKYLMLLAVLAMMLVLPACGNDEPGWKDRDVEFPAEMLNHVYDNTLNQGQVAKSKNKLVFHRSKLTADLQLQPAVPALGDAALDVKGLAMTVDEETGRYAIKASTTSNQRVTNLTATIDFNEQAMAIYYTVDGRYRVMATMTEVFFLGNSSTLNYDDGKASNDKESVYQFDIDPESMTATMKVAPLTNTQAILKFENIIARGISVEITKDGYNLKADSPLVVSILKRIDTSEGTLTTIDAPDEKTGRQLYPMRNMSAHLSLADGAHTTTFTMGSLADGTHPFTVQGKGNFYQDKLIK